MNFWQTLIVAMCPVPGINVRQRNSQYQPKTTPLASQMCPKVYQMLFTMSKSHLEVILGHF